MYVYIESESGVYTVGFYDPEGMWHSNSDHGSREEALKMVARLNGSNLTEVTKKALLEAKAVAMRNVFGARIPECGEFGSIAQNLAYVCQELGIE